MRRIFVYLTLVLLATVAAAPAAIAEEEKKDESRIVIRSVHPCPEVKVLGDSGKTIQWLGRSNRAFLGVEPSALTPELRGHFGVPEDAGVLIARVVEDSAAANAGLAVGDIVTRIDGEAIDSPNSLGRAVRQKGGGAEVEIEYWRGRQRYTSTVTLGEQERCGIDIGNMPFLELENLEGLGEKGIVIGQEALDKLRAVDWQEALRGLEDIDWDKHLKGLQELDVERLEKHMEKVRERLEKLEKTLEREQERLDRLEERREPPEGDGSGV